MQPEGLWVREDGIVRLAGPSGERISPSAPDIYDAEFEGLTVVDGYTVRRPSADLSELSFESGVAPIAPALRQADDGTIVLQLELDTPDRPRLDGWPAYDQLIVGGSWYALLAGVSELRVGFEDHGIELNTSLNGEQVLRLLWDEGLAVDSFLPKGPLGGFRAPMGEATFDASVLNATLYAYQRDGAGFLSQLAQNGLGALLADEMGLGKTMQAMYLITAAVRRGDLPNLVIVPASTLANWNREFSRFADGVPVLEHAGPRRTGDPNVLRRSPVVLTTYETALRDQSLFEMVEWTHIALDEAQSVKNPRAQRSRAVKALKKRTGLAITGTPIENSLTDMWSIFEFVLPQYLGSLDDFQASYPDELDAAAALSRRVAPLVLRRMVDSVATDLPERVDIPTPVYFSPTLVEAYEAVRTDEDLHPLARLTALRQLCASPLPAGLPSIEHEFPKFDRLLDIVTEVLSEGSKCLIFASYTQAIDQIAEAIARRFEATFVATIDGRRSPAERQGLIDQFTSFGGAGVLVMNPKAAGVGLNIQAANYVVHFTPEWNPATVAQASARAYRRGQKRPVFVYYLYYEGTVEQYMMERLDAKRELQAAGLSEVTDEPRPSELQEALGLSPRERTPQHE